MIAYLLGILPKGYTLTSWEALKKEGSLNVQAGTAFVDFEFLEEVRLLEPNYIYLLFIFFFISSRLFSLFMAKISYNFVLIKLELDLSRME